MLPWYFFLATSTLLVLQFTMTYYIYYCQTLINLVSKGGSSELNRGWFQARGPRLAVYALYGSYVELEHNTLHLPSFCISSKLFFTHISLLGYVSVVFPLCLIAIT